MQLRIVLDVVLAIDLQHRNGLSFKVQLTRVA